MSGDPLPELTFAVGDIHGCMDKLERLMRACRAYAGKRSAGYVLLGDYIDRGPDSREVVAFAMASGFVCLKGNHEAVLEETLKPGADPGWWLDLGGEDTLLSYGVARAADLPADHVAFLAGTRLYFDDGLRFFVHAGIDPKRPLAAQEAETLLWTRAKYPDDIDVGRFIVHGHTPQRSGRPDLRPNRVNIDTGAVFGRNLTAAVFSATQLPPIAFIADNFDIVELPAAELAMRSSERR